MLAVDSSQQVGCFRVSVIRDSGPSSHGCQRSDDCDKSVSDGIAQFGLGVGCAGVEVITKQVHLFVAMGTRVLVIRVAQGEWESQLALPHHCEDVIG